MAVALVEPELSCLIVQPEDCLPTIEVPRGSLVSRRYRRPIQPVGEALSAFLLELIPHWEPLEPITERVVPIIEVEPDVQDQVAAGGRARKTNPKRKALTSLGEKDAAGIADLVLEVHDGRVQPDAVEDALRRLMGTR